MTLLVHIGDIHAKEKATAKENRRFARVMDWVAKRYKSLPKPLLTFTGDLTNNGSNIEYDHVLRVLKPLRAQGFEMIFAPGNHDVGPLGNTFSASRQNNFQRRILGELMGIDAAATTNNQMAALYPLIKDTGECRLVALDSCHSERHLASGIIGRRQLDALAVAIEEATTPVVVLLHHHPFVRRTWLRLADAKPKLRPSVRDDSDLKATLEGKIAALLFGHKHRSEVWQSRKPWDIPLIIAAGKTSKPDRRKLYEIREVEVSPGVQTMFAYHRRLPRRRGSSVQIRGSQLRL